VLTGRVLQASNAGLYSTGRILRVDGNERQAHRKVSRPRISSRGVPYGGNLPGPAIVGLFGVNSQTFRARPGGSNRAPNMRPRHHSGGPGGTIVICQIPALPLVETRASGTAFQSGWWGSATYTGLSSHRFGVMFGSRRDRWHSEPPIRQPGPSPGPVGIHFGRSSFGCKRPRGVCLAIRARNGRGSTGPVPGVVAKKKPDRRQR